MSYFSYFVLVAFWSTYPIQLQLVEKFSIIPIKAQFFEIPSVKIDGQNPGWPKLQRRSCRKNETFCFGTHFYQIFGGKNPKRAGTKLDANIRVTMFFLYLFYKLNKLFCVFDIIS